MRFTPFEIRCACSMYWYCVPCTVFNIGGNKYRLTAYVSYTLQVVGVNRVMTHAEYNREKWKKECEK
ncbi:MAG: type II toxin-antitoxin system HigB family toxin [Blastocatellia bacterium]